MNNSDTTMSTFHADDFRNVWQCTMYDGERNGIVIPDALTVTERIIKNLDTECIKTAGKISRFNRDGNTGPLAAACEYHNGLKDKINILLPMANDIREHREEARNRFSSEWCRSGCQCYACRGYDVIEANDRK